MDDLRIVIVDDQRMFRDNLKTVIELSLPGAEVVGLANDGAEGLDVIRRARPNLAIIDMNMPGMSGIECIRQLRDEGNDVMVIVLTIFDDDNHVIDALKLGVVAYLLKDMEPERFIEAIRLVHNGSTLLSQQVAEKLADEAVRTRAQACNDFSEELLQLTQRELEILKHIALGENNQEIAGNLFLSEGTVRNYVSNIYDKLGFKDRAQATRFALMSKLI